MRFAKGREASQLCEDVEVECVRPFFVGYKAKTLATAAGDKAATTGSRRRRFVRDVTVSSTEGVNVCRHVWRSLCEKLGTVLHCAGNRSLNVEDLQR